MHNSSVHTENGFRGVPLAVAYRGKRSDQATTVYFIHVHTLATERRRPTLAAFPKKTGFRKHRSNIDIHVWLAVVTFVLFPIYYLTFATS